MAHKDPQEGVQRSTGVETNQQPIQELSRLRFRFTVSKLFMVSFSLFGGTISFFVRSIVVLSVDTSVLSCSLSI